MDEGINNAMRILLISGIFPPDIGGPATYVPQIAHGLTERGHEVQVITLSDRKSDNDDYPFRVIRLSRGMFKPWRILHTVWTIWRVGRWADVLFVNGLALESVLANIFLGKPLVMKVVGDLAWERATNWGRVDDNFEVFQQRRYGLRVELLKALRSWWTRQAHRLIVPSQYLARWVRKWGVSEDRIVVIYNAVELINNIEPVWVPLSTPIKLVTVVRLVPWKGVDGILRALTEIPEAGLIVIGDGPERPRLETLAQSLGVQDRVYFAGTRNREETLAWMAACDVFVLNSTYEGLPHVVLEAMALGLPVVATAVGGTPEVVKDGKTGVLISTHDYALDSVLSGLISDSTWRSPSRKAKIQKLIEQEFSIVKMIEETEAVIQQVVDGRLYG